MQDVTKLFIVCRLYEKLIVLVTKCEVYSVRATCFSALGLIAGTQAGANILFKLSKCPITNVFEKLIVS